MSELLTTYTNMVNNFYLLFPDKKDTIKLSEHEIKSYVCKFCEKLRLAENKGYFKMLVNRQGKLFKGLKCSLLPKFKMEVVLNVDENTTNEHKQHIDNIWANIWMLYILEEVEQTTPDKIKMSQIAMAIDCSKLNEVASPSNLNNGSELFKMMNAQMENMTDDQKKSVNEMMDAIKNPTIESNNIAKVILSDLKEQCKITCDADGKVDSKKFVDQLFKAGSAMSESYSDKLKSGEISITDLLGMISSLTDGNSEGLMNELSEVTEALQLDKMDLNEVKNEFINQLSTGELKGKIPPEILKTLTELNGDNLKNMDMGKLMESMLIGKEDEKAQELTIEQKKELEEFYSNLTL